LTLPVEEIQIGDRHLLEVRRAFLDSHQPVRLRIRQRFEQHRVDDAEDRRIGADPQGQREHRDGRNHLPLEQHSHRIANVFEERIHGTSWVTGLWFVVCGYWLRVTGSPENSRFKIPNSKLGEPLRNPQPQTTNHKPQTYSALNAT